MRLIDADRLLDRCKFYNLPNGDKAIPIIDIQHAPTVKIQHNIGEWKELQFDPYAFGERPTMLYCTSCNQCVLFPTKFCANCGADMRGINEDK